MIGRLNHVAIAVRDLAVYFSQRHREKFRASKNLSSFSDSFGPGFENKSIRIALAPTLR